MSSAMRARRSFAAKDAVLQVPQLLGIIGLEDLLKARELTLEEEHKKERALRLHLPWPCAAWKASVKIGCSARPWLDDPVHCCCS